MQAVEWTGRSLRYIDQKELPAREVTIETDDPQNLFQAIRALAIRGAPLIGIASAYATTLEARKLPADVARRDIHGRMEKFLETFGRVRPTAVNLRWALERMREVLEDDSWGDPEELARSLETEALRIHDEDRRSCDAIGAAGSELIRTHSAVMTHCNTGALATGGDGTALNVIRRAHALGAVKRVYVGETRPLLQGSRLTAWELSKLGIPYSIISDSSAAWLMKRAMIQSVIVGADRIAANGDVANKIGTYALAVIARYHGIPLYVAAPVSTVDASLRTGREIPIEERPAEELTRMGTMELAPRGAGSYSPAFDVTPHELVSAIITDRGVLVPPFESALAALDLMGRP